MIKPWITPYADERHEGAFALDHRANRIFFPESTGIVEDRTLGVLWQPCPDKPTGPIFWREMHTGRQRQAMVEALCQVCGQAAEGDAAISWLLPNIEVRVRKVRGQAFTTNTPPTCARCIPLAAGACPNLSRNPGMRLAVKHYRPWGVFGDYVGPSGQLMQGDLPFGHELIPRMMARHLVVEVFDYRKVRS